MKELPAEVHWGRTHILSTSCARHCATALDLFEATLWHVRQSWGDVRGASRLTSITSFHGSLLALLVTRVIGHDTCRSENLPPFHRAREDGLREAMKD